MISTLGHRVLRRRGPRQPGRDCRALRAIRATTSRRFNVRPAPFGGGALLQTGLALIGPDNLAGLGGLLHEWLQFWMRDQPVLSGPRHREGHHPRQVQWARRGAADPLLTGRAVRSTESDEPW